MAEYECYLDAQHGGKKAPVNQETTLRLRDPMSMESFDARVIVRPSFEEYPQAEKMYYFAATVGREKEPVPIEILERMEEKATEVKALPRQKLSLGERKGRMLSDMIKERSEKKKPT